MDLKGMSMSEALQEYVEGTIKCLVDKPKEVRVNVSVSTKNVIIQISVAKDDCGKVIGKKGKTIDALKVLVLAIKNTAFSKDLRKISIEILEDENSNFTSLKK